MSSETLTGVRIAADDEQVLALRSIPLERTVTDIHAPGIAVTRSSPLVRMTLPENSLKKFSHAVRECSCFPNVECEKPF